MGSLVAVLQCNCFIDLAPLFGFLSPVADRFIHVVVLCFLQLALIWLLYHAVLSCCWKYFDVLLGHGQSVAQSLDDLHVNKKFTNDIWLSEGKHN